MTTNGTDRYAPLWRLSVANGVSTGVLFGLMMMLSACGDIFGNDSNDATQNSYTVMGTVAGLSTGSLVLQNNGADDLTITADGGFTLAGTMADGTLYNVSVLTQPTGQTCSVSNGTGTISGSNVSNVSVTCAVNDYTVGGTVTGLSGTVVLQNNNDDDVSLSADGVFSFPERVATGSTYSVTVLTQPTAQSCSVANGTGTVTNAAITEVTDITISCAATHTVGGTISGLKGSILVRNNGADDYSTAVNGPFTFATAVPAGTTYAVTLPWLQLPNQTCTATNATGTVTENVTNIAIDCVGHTAPRFAYVSSVGTTQNGAGDASQYTVGNDGVLTPLTPAGIATGGDASGIVAHPNGQYVYAATYGSGVAQYAVGTDGTLSLLDPQNAPVAGSGNAIRITIDPTGRFVYVVGGTTVSQFRVASDGKLEALDPATVTLPDFPNRIVVDALGRYAYVTSWQDRVISQFDIASDGRLLAMTPATVATIGQPSAITTTGNGQHVYVYASGQIERFTVGGTGALTAAGTPVVTGSSLSMAIDPTDSWLYAANVWDNQIAQFSIEADGSLLPLTPATVTPTNPANPEHLHFAPGGRFLYVGNRGHGQPIPQFEVTANGTLSQIANGPAIVGGGGGSGIAFVGGPE